jgi:hypothetical protein
LPDLLGIKILDDDESDAVTLNWLMRPWPGLWERQKKELCGEHRDRATI